MKYSVCFKPINDNLLSSTFSFFFVLQSFVCSSETSLCVRKCGLKHLHIIIKFIQRTNREEKKKKRSENNKSKPLIRLFGQKLYIDGNEKSAPFSFGILFVAFDRAMLQTWFSVYWIIIVAYFPIVRLSLFGDYCVCSGSFTWLKSLCQKTQTGKMEICQLHNFPVEFNLMPSFSAYWFVYLSLGQKKSPSKICAMEKNETTWRKIAEIKASNSKFH